MILDKTRALVAILLTLAMAACNHAPAGAPSPSPSGVLVVVATTSTLAALVRTVADDTISVHALVPIGVSPETYEPTPRDLIELSHAALVVENGAGLESWLDKLITSSATHARVVALSDAITGSAGGANGSQLTVNPHFWLDPNYAELYVARIAHELAQIDPANAARYRANAAAEINRLSVLDTWTRRRIATIPQDRRAMIAQHDAWYYFDKRYGIRDVGVIETSPGKEPSAGELAALIATAKANNVHAIFAEPEFSPKLAQQLAEGANIKTVTDLYDDSLGTTPLLSSYEGRMHHNVDTIVEALGS